MSGDSLIRALSKREVLVLAVGAMIGWSWVIMTGIWLNSAGTLGTLLAFLVGGIAILLISLTYAELVSAMPKAGGEHVYTERAFGKLGSFVCTWAIIMAYITVPTFESAALPVALEYIFPEIKVGFLWSVFDADIYLSSALIGVVASILMTVTNFVGIRFMAVIQTTITAAFLIIGWMFLMGVASEFNLTYLTPLFVDEYSGFFAVLAMIPALMIGFDVIPQSAEEINLKPQMIGKILVFSVAISILWYCLISLGVSLSMTSAELATSTMATADAHANVWHGQWAGNLTVIGGIAGIITSWNAFILGGSRAIYALAKSNLLPPIFAKLHPKYKTPYAAIILIGVLCCVSPFFGRTILVWLINAGSFAVVLGYGMVAYAFLKLRQNEPDMARPFRVKHGKIVGWSALIISICLFWIYLPWGPSALLWPYEWAMVIGWAGLGLIFYLITKKSKTD
ncbi:APC family permease [Thalassomonas sp. M1454]|uniref:APC family permease n=1 Tax=Thalassomonas sp. M1454 TaxID=2594477 RepID=UPI00117C14F7|nr:amino acid permease [Thalassomonas sp. M1454]TRX55113.1 amino acid permease [Thalassomonas sp. M1454]